MDKNKTLFILKKNGSLVDNEDILVEEVPYALGRCYSLVMKRPLIAGDDLISITIHPTGSNRIGKRNDMRIA